MANNVYTYVSFENMSEKASTFLEQFGQISYSMDEGVSFLYGDIKTYYEYDVFVEIVGAKWCNTEDYSGYGISFVSAWCAPIALLDTLFKKLQSLESPDLLMWCRYDDEMPNFIGVYGRYKDAEWDECVEDGYYKESVGDTPYNTITNEDGEEEHEWSDTWSDSLDTFCDIEYNDFKSSINEEILYRTINNG